MIIVEIIGGVGNQMFQYAFAKALALRNNLELKLDVTGFREYKLRDFSLTNFNIEQNFATEEEIKALKRKKRFFNTFIMEQSLKFNPRLLKSSDNKYFQGYWQAEQYFEDFKDEIRKDFNFKGVLSERGCAIADVLTQENAVSLHVRRGDYVGNPYHETDLAQYYKDAISHIVKNVQNPVFYVFSDDKDYARKAFSDFKIVQNLTDIEEMRLMSLCKHNIIANSSFSWWGAWLNENEGKIVTAPKAWFNAEQLNSETIVPKSWLQL